jgi:hypothetical protein
MAYSARQLIVNSWYTSGIISQQTQTVSAPKIFDGLNLLNDLLAIKTANTRLIPYYNQLILSAVIGQEGYFIENLIEIESLTFNIGPIRYPMQPASRKKYFATSRVDNINSLPFTYHLEREFGGAKLYIYFFPQSNYPLTLWGKFSLSEVTLDQDLSLTLDRFYIVYLRYALAEYMCAFLNIAMQQPQKEKLEELENMLVDISPIDLSTSKISSLQEVTGINYGDINIGMGWRP